MTLMIREVGTGLSGQKASLQQMVSFGAEPSSAQGNCRRQLFDRRLGEDVKKSGDTSLAESGAFGRQTHALLGSQSFQGGAGAHTVADSVNLNLNSASKLCAKTEANVPTTP